MKIIGKILRYLMLEGSAFVLMVVLFAFFFSEWGRDLSSQENMVLFWFSIGILLYLLMQSVAAVYRPDEKAMGAKAAIIDLLVSSLPLLPIAVAGTLYALAHPPFDLAPVASIPFDLTQLQKQVLSISLIAVIHDLLVNTLVPLKYKQCYEKGQNDQKNRFVMDSSGS